MADNNTKKDTKEQNKISDFNIIVSYANDGKDFQTIMENIILRRLDEVE